MNINWADEAAKADAEGKTEALKTEQGFRPLPGDPVKGTRYQGVIRKIYVQPLNSKDAANHGRDTLFVTIMVVGGSHHGWTESFTRTLDPVTLDQPSEETQRVEIEKLMKTGKTEEQAIDEFVGNWRNWRKNFRLQNYQTYQKLGVEIEGKTDAEIVNSLALAVNNPVEFTVYDKSQTKERRKFLEFPMAARSNKMPEKAENTPLLTNLEIPID